MNIMSALASPLCLTMLTIAAGYLAGKIRVGRVQLQMAGVLFVAIMMGALIAQVPALHIAGRCIAFVDETLLDNMRWLSSLGTALFVAAIGIQSGYQFRDAFQKQHILFLLLGATAVSATALLTALIGRVDKKIGTELLVGVFCGAMTSTPGLAAASEVLTDATSVTIGYGNAYLFGLLSAVVAVQMLKPPSGTVDENNIQSADMDVADLKGFALMAIVIAFGKLMGAIPIPGMPLGVGDTGGILLSGILLGCLYPSKKQKHRVPTVWLTTFRNLGLVFFLTGKGIPSGIGLFNNLNLRSFLYAIVITAFALCIAMLCGYTVSKRNRKTALYCLCGVMTSTPALGVLMEGENDKKNLTIYSSVYLGALLANIILSRGLVLWL